MEEGALLDYTPHKAQWTEPLCRSPGLAAGRGFTQRRLQLVLNVGGGSAEQQDPKWRRNGGRLRLEAPCVCPGSLDLCWELCVQVSGLVFVWAAGGLRPGSVSDTLYCRFSPGWHVTRSFSTNTTAQVLTVSEGSTGLSCSCRFSTCSTWRRGETGSEQDPVCDPDPKHTWEFTRCSERYLGPG